MIPILYKDGDIAVVSKPAGVDSQSSSGKDMVSILSSQLGCEVFPVHRLDRETQGVMLYALTREAAAQLSSSFAENKVTKTYAAAIIGTPDEKSGEMRDLLFHDRFKNKTYIAKSKRSGVKEARLAYSVVASDEGRSLSLVTVHLFTGRTHQIRVQFASRRHPVAGDGKYGGKCQYTSNLALACVRLTFRHPKSGDEMTFFSFPEDDIFHLFGDVEDNMI